MLLDSTINRIFIRVSILALRAVAPVSILWCGLVFTRTIPPPPTRSGILVFTALTVWCTAESLFFTCIYLPYRHILNRPAAYINPLSTPTLRRQQFDLTLSAHPNPRECLSLWFHSAPIESLHREDVLDFLCWRSFNCTTRHDSDNPELEEYLTHYERLLNTTFPAGRGPHKSMAVTFEPIRSQHRPLFWYIFIMGGTDLQLCLTMLYRGFSFHPISSLRTLSTIPWRPLSFLAPPHHYSPAEHLSYWHIPHTSLNHIPIVFMHGIGVGLHYYLDFFADYLSTTSMQPTDGTTIGLLAIEYPPITNRITFPALISSKHVSEIHAILSKHNITHCVLVTHSYSSIIATHLLHSPLTAPLFTHSVFIDPVAFSFHTPHLAYNFLRRRSVTASQIQLQYFASYDLMVAHALTRKFVWVENSLWREDLEERYRSGECKATVCLAAADIITDVEHLGRYLTRLVPSEAKATVSVASADAENGDVDDNTSAITRVKNETKTKVWYETYENETDEERTSWKTKPWTGKEGLEVIWFEDCNHAEEFENKYGRDDRGRILKVLRVYAQDGKKLVEKQRGSDGQLRERIGERAVNGGIE